MRRRRRRPRLPRPAVAVRRPGRRLPRRSRTIAHPSLGTVAAALRRHTELLVEFFGSEEWACRDIRKHISWYFKGYPVGGDTRAALALVESLQQMDDLLGTLDWDAPYPGEPAEGPRGRAGTPKRPALPERWLDSHELDDEHRRRPRPRARGTPAVADSDTQAGYGDHDLQRWLPEDASEPPQRLRPRPGAPAALQRAAPARREDPGAEPGRRTRLRPQPAHPLPGGRPGRPRTGHQPRAATRTSWTPPASPTTSGIRRSATTASAR